MRTYLGIEDILTGLCKFKTLFASFTVLTVMETLTMHVCMCQLLTVPVWDEDICFTRLLWTHTWTHMKTFALEGHP